MLLALLAFLGKLIDRRIFIPFHFSFDINTFSISLILQAVAD